MSKNAWSTGYRFVAVAALALGASGALTGTAAANDGATGHTGCPKAVAKKATGCHDSAGRKAKPAWSVIGSPPPRRRCRRMTDASSRRIHSSWRGRFCQARP